MKERRGLLCRSFALKNEVIETADGAQQVEEEEEKKEMEKPRETLLYSIAPLPLLFDAALPGGVILSCIILSATLQLLFHLRSICYGNDC